MDERIRVVTFGETMGLLRAAEIGSLATVSDLRLGIGGAESNVAIGLRRLGTTSAWIGRLGRDSVGERIERELRAEGVVLRTSFDSTAGTGLMMKERRTPQNSRVSYYRRGSAGSRLEPADLDDELIAQSDLLHLTGITPGLSASAEDTTFRALDIAQRAGIPVSFDVNHRDGVWSSRDPRATYRRILEAATIVFAGEDEARMLAGPQRGSFEPELIPELLHAIGDAGPSHVLIKRGALGCAALIDAEVYVQRAVPIEVIDTVGAGDAFAAAYLAEWLSGEPPARRLVTATAAGAFACLSPGDWEGLPSRADLRLLTDRDPVTR